MNQLLNFSKYVSKLLRKAYLAVFFFFFYFSTYIIPAGM